MREYSITVDRKTGVLYLAWEYGLQGAVAMLRRPGTREGHRINLTRSADLYGATRKRGRMDEFARHVRAAAAYMQGRLGQGLHGSVIEIERAAS